MSDVIDLQRAAAETELETFLRAIFPPTWGGVLRAIIESGAWFADPPVRWAPRWSPIPLTVKGGPTPEIAAVKSVLYRAHDALHQLWGLPVPLGFDEEEFYLYKRAQMCGEVAVLQVCEMMLGSWISDQCPSVRAYIDTRCAVPMYRNELQGKSDLEIAARMDGLLHRHVRPRWVRDSRRASAFVDYYLPLLEQDRKEIDYHWGLLRTRTDWSLAGAPETRYDSSLDGQELTIWMIRDFKHLLRSGARIDYGLARFNRERRESLRLPDGWGNPEGAA